MSEDEYSEVNEQQALEEFAIAAGSVIHPQDVLYAVAAPGSTDDWCPEVPKNRQRHPGAARRGGVSFARKLVAMKPFLADTLKRTARALVKLANLIDRPTIRLYDKQWNEVDKLPGWSRRIATTLAGSAPTLPRHG